MPANYKNPLPGVPHVESPFFEELFDTSDPRFPIAATLREKGYVVIDFPEQELDKMAARIKRDLHDLYDWKNWHDGSADMRYMDAWRHHADVRRIATNSAISDLLTYLYGRRAFPFQTLNFPVGTQQHYHTDSVHFSCRPERFMCGVWVALEDIGPRQGPLIYYPGSHQWPIYTREHISERYTPAGGSHQSVFEPLWERLVEINDAKPDRFFAKRGQALIWAANLLHGGDAHHDRSATRWSQVTHYYFDDCAYYTPLGSNEPAGEILHRAPIDIATDIAHPSAYLGQPLSPSFIEETRPNRRLDAGFDPQLYLESNPDVAAAGVDPWEHYEQFGRAEGRRW